MSLDKLAVELEETARQTAEMIDKINDSLGVLMNNKLDSEDARSTAIQQMLVALQAQDRIQQRSDNIAKAARLMAKVIDDISENIEHKDIWSELTLDELRKPNLSGIAGRAKHDDIELF